MDDNDDSELIEADRIEQHYRRLGTRSPRCLHPGCDENHPAAMFGCNPEIWCYEHLPRRRGGEFELQHPSGEANDPISKIQVRPNDHRVWDDAKRDWPERTRQNPDGSPLLRASAAVRSLLDWCRFIIERLLGWVPRFLESLDESLRSLHGERWWAALDIA